MAPAAADGDPFFGHAPRPTGGRRPLQHATRYLAAGTYLRTGFERLVISELMDDHHRAVVPSYGHDLEPVLRHALRARRLRLCRDLALIGLWSCLLVLAPAVAFGFGFALVVTVFLLALVGRRLPRWAALAVAAVIGAWLLAAGGVALLGALAENFAGSGDGFGGLDSGDGFGDVPDPATGPQMPAVELLIVLLLILAMAVVIFGHLAVVLRALSRELVPGATGPGPDTGGDRARETLARIGSAQNGNITLYANQNPFLGAGAFDAPSTRVWAIALELDRPAADRLNGPRRTERVDPVVMYERVRAAMQSMRDEWPPQGPGEPEPGPAQWLPLHERVVNLVIGDHVVGHGLRDQRPGAATPAGGDPLIDPRGGGVPYSLAGGPAIDAIMRHPQAATRYYQRITVGAQAQAITGRDGRTVVPAEEQDFSLTTFVHLAVEGHMLYAEFAAVALPPIRDDFRIVDLMPSWDTAALLAQAFLVGWQAAPSTALLAVPRTARTCWQMARGALGIGLARPPTERTMHNYGARLSIRELAAAPDFSTFMQVLDIEKYTRLVQQRVNDALLDHLENECGIDVSAYRSQAEQLMNNGVIITGGNVSGQVAAGGRVQQQQTGPSGAGS